MTAAFDSNVDVTIEIGFRNRVYMETDGSGWVSTPDSAALSVTGDIDLRWFGAPEELPDDETPLIAKWAPGGERSYGLFIRGRRLLLRLAQSSTNTASVTSGDGLEPIAAAGGEFVGLRATWRASDDRVQFFTSHDNGDTWTQLGANQIISGASIFDSTAEVRVASTELVPGVFPAPFVGRVHRAEIRDGIDGTIVGEVDFSSQGWQVGDDAGDTGSDGTNTWTLQGDAVLDDRPALFDPNPIWTDVSDQVKAASWRRGRPSTQNDFPAGTGELLLDNTEGDFYQWDTTSPHYPYVMVGVQVRIRATHNSVTYPLFRGYVSSWSQPFPTNSEELVRAELTEHFARLEGKKVSRTFATEKTDERISAVLDRVRWPVALRDLDSGVAKVAGREWLKVTALFLIRTALEAEQGQVFQAANGDLTFRNRVASTGGVGSQATFGPDGAELTYVDVTVIHNDDLLINEAIISAGAVVDGEREVEGHAADDRSMAVHGPVTYTTENLSIFASPEALNVAKWIVAKGKDVKPRIAGFAIDPAGDPDNLWPEVLSRELRDVVTVEVSYPGAVDQLVQDVALESISHSFQAGGVWTATYGCHPLSDAEQETFFVLDSSQLDGTDVLA